MESRSQQFSEPGRVKFFLSKLILNDTLNSFYLTYSNNAEFSLFEEIFLIVEPLFSVNVLLSPSTFPDNSNKYFSNLSVRVNKFSVYKNFMGDYG